MQSWPAPLPGAFTISLVDRCPVPAGGDAPSVEEVLRDARFCLSLVSRLIDTFVLSSVLFIFMVPIKTKKRKRKRKSVLANCLSADTTLALATVGHHDHFWPRRFSGGRGGGRGPKFRAFFSLPPQFQGVSSETLALCGNVHISGWPSKSSPKFNERTQERHKKNENCGVRGKNKSQILGGPAEGRGSNRKGSRAKGSGANAVVCSVQIRR